MNNSDGLIMLKVNFCLKIPLDTGIALSSIKLLESNPHMFVELKPNIADIEVSKDFDFMSDLGNLGIGKLDCKIYPILLKTLGILLIVFFADI